MTNTQRAEVAEKVLRYFGTLVPNDDDIKTLSVDLISDLCHLLNRKGIDPNEVFRRSLEHFDAEHYQEGRDFLRNNYGV